MAKSNEADEKETQSIMELQKLKQSISDYEREIASLTKGTIEEDIKNLK